MTLGCGAIAGNSTSDNIGPMHLLNIKRIAYHVRDAEQAFQSEEGRAWFAGKPLPAAGRASCSRKRSVHRKRAGPAHR